MNHGYPHDGHRRCSARFRPSSRGPYIDGWKNHPSLPVGLVHEGVDAYAGVPLAFAGETGAQSKVADGTETELERWADQVLTAATLDDVFR